MYNPKISIIIPVYNGSNYLGEAIKSALAQTYKNIEILVINDGSNDNGETEKLAQSFGDKIKYYCKENGGVSTALNLGIEKMTGEYFSWLSHDDLYFPNKIEEQVNFLEKLDNKEVIIYSNFDLVNENGIFKESIYIAYGTKAFLYNFLTKKNLSGITLLIPKKCLLTVGKFEEGLETSQDYKQWFKLLKKYNFYHINKTTCAKRIHPGQDSQIKRSIGIKETKKLENFVLSYFSIIEIKKSADSKLPDLLFYIYLKLILKKPKFINLLRNISKKVGIYNKLSKLWIKYILKK